jgi:hypothetical protein
MMEMSEECPEYKTNIKEMFRTIFFSMLLTHLSASPDAQLKGYYWQTWETKYAAPSNTNMGIAFSGWVNMKPALSESSQVKEKLPGFQMFSIGGGNNNGYFTSSSLISLDAAISGGSLAGYDGIVYDIEKGDSGLTSNFAASFALAKSKGLMVVVTVSHSAPYGVDDGATLMRSFFSNPDIDYISPQLYTTGEETSNDYETSKGVSWSEYASAKAAIAPSIVIASLYEDAQQQFSTYGITTYGYIQWQQTVNANALSEVRGYYWQTWQTGYSAPTNANVGIAFSGWSNVDQALAESASVKSKLPGTKVFSVGGGNANGRFTTASLTTLTNAIASDALKSYSGVVYDVEQGDSGLASSFSASFAAAKSKGLMVIVTCSHSAPFNITDAATLMSSFFADSNIDYLSPQLYSSGNELTNDFTISHGVNWTEYATAKAAVAPSIVNSSYYTNAQVQFLEYGIITVGYLQWQQSTGTVSTDVDGGDDDKPPIPPWAIAVIVLGICVFVVLVHVCWQCCKLDNNICCSRGHRYGGVGTHDNNVELRTPPKKTELPAAPGNTLSTSGKKSKPATPPYNDDNKSSTRRNLDSQFRESEKTSSSSSPRANVLVTTSSKQVAL